MKKWIKRVAISVPILAVLLITLLVVYFVRSVENFRQITFQDVIEARADYYDEHFGITGKSDPGDYGFPGYETLEYLSEADNIKLHAWHISAAKTGTDKCIVLIHGRGANKMRTMKYLASFKEGGITGEYSVFIPDFRNSGLSGKGKTLMGPKFAEDGYYTLKLLKEKYGYKKFILYGFSMGAMASALMVNDEKIKELDIVVEKIIMDSPLADVRANLRFTSVELMKIPQPLFDLGFFVLDKKNSGKISSLRLSELIADIEIPVLIFQSENDPKTPYKIFAEERKKLEVNKNITFKIYPLGEHVKIYQNRDNMKDYTAVLNSFIKK